MSLLKTTLLLTTGVVIGAIGAVKYAEHLVHTRTGELKINLKPSTKPEVEGVMHFTAEMLWTTLKPFKLIRGHYVDIATRRLDNGNIIIEIDNDKDAVDFLGETDARNLVEASGYNPADFTYQTTRTGIEAVVKPSLNAEPIIIEPVDDVIKEVKK